MITALVLAALYFSLMQLLLVDSSRALAEAQQFRARVVALTLAESGAELAAKNLVTTPSNAVPPREDPQGRMEASLRPTSDGFMIHGVGTSGGVVTKRATVDLKVSVHGTAIHIDYADHSQ